MFDRILAQARAGIAANGYLAEPPPGDECGRCKGAMYVTRTKFKSKGHWETETVKCPSCTELPVEERQRDAGIFNVKTFAEWKPTEGMVEAYQAVMRVLDGEMWCALLRGSPGCGKTHLAIATAVAWIEQGKGRAQFVNVPNYLAALKETFSTDASAEEVFERYARASLLVLDDLGTEYRKGQEMSWADSEVFRLIDWRYERKAPLIVTSNQRYNDRFDERVLSRLRPGQVIIRDVSDRRMEFERGQTGE